ncbi:MAG TPA: hypothetical protein ENI69_06780 [Rhodospirillales bacterium]|nr:hypothetical protein [Rhodospirillales bacterium]
MLGKMKSDSVLVDVSIDQGGCGGARQGLRSGGRNPHRLENT